MSNCTKVTNDLLKFSERVDHSVTRASASGKATQKTQILSSFAFKFDITLNRAAPPAW
eukprot:COSAG01_NODE_256_length_20138_cov_24.233694_17_plen_58_part_00